MSQRSLWGEVPVQSVGRTLRSLLQEQADMLSEMTGKILQGRVRMTKPEGGRYDFLLGFYIVAPLLDNYQYQILEVRHGIKLYPAQVSGESLPSLRTVRNEERFLETVENILSSKEVHSVISALLAQSKDERDVSH